jgi:glucan biosynthesis protein C
MTLPDQIRLDYLDAARAFALLLGVLFHSSLSFMPIFIGWAVMDVSTSEIASIFVMISHSFRMELFFLLAGFFSHMKFHQQTFNVFFKSRLVRIAVPFLIGWVILRPLLVSGWVIGAESMQGDAQILAGIIQGVKSLIEAPYSLLVGTHLWFLYYLLLVTAMVLVLRQLLLRLEATSAAIISVVDRSIEWLSRSPWSLFLIAIPTSVCLWFMRHWGVDTPDKSLQPEWPVLLLYFGCFLFGWLLHRQRDAITNLATLHWYNPLIYLVACILSLVLTQYETQAAEPNYWLFKAAFTYSYAVMMWSLVTITLGVCRKLFSKNNAVVRYIADSSYWLYLIHLPIVIALQIAIAELDYPWYLKLLLVTASTVTIALLIYDLLVRSTAIGALLNGKRKSRVIFATRSKLAD